MAVKHCLLYTVYAEMKTNRKMRQTLYVRHQLGKVGGGGEWEDVSMLAATLNC